jgi:hypothetical protein
VCAWVRDRQRPRGGTRASLSAFAGPLPGRSEAGSIKDEVWGPTTTGGRSPNEKKRGLRDPSGEGRSERERATAPRLTAALDTEEPPNFEGRDVLATALRFDPAGFAEQGSRGGGGGCAPASLGDGTFVDNLFVSSLARSGAREGSRTTFEDTRA